MTCESRRRDRWGTVHTCERGEHADLLHQTREGLMWTDAPFIDATSVVAAVQFTGDNAMEVYAVSPEGNSAIAVGADAISVMSFAGWHADGTIRRPRPKLVLPGQWVVQYTHGHVFVFDDDRFNEEYRVSSEMPQ